MSRSAAAVRVALLEPPASLGSLGSREALERLGPETAVVLFETDRNWRAIQDVDGDGLCEFLQLYGSTLPVISGRDGMRIKEFEPDWKSNVRANQYFHCNLSNSSSATMISATDSRRRV